ncbi:hypothetical protein [Lacticaseibacillus manihotivorans]|uniref:hypothetical protein n=1 Tax=Lacticaseibacillus manihotivorans TaxID=88233 RepID=UPI001FB37DBC|nr:hypothetical protein [Lacticaseibacillus manihotivorans]
MATTYQIAYFSRTVVLSDQPLYLYRDREGPFLIAFRGNTPMICLPTSQIASVFSHNIEVRLTLNILVILRLIMLY